MAVEINDFKDRIAAYTEKVQADVVKAVADTANAIAENAQKNTSSELADSITVEMGDDGLSATITSNSPDALSAEYGLNKHKEKIHHGHRREEDIPGTHSSEHNKMPKPFLNPAFEEQRPVFLQALQQIFI